MSQENSSGCINQANSNGSNGGNSSTPKHHSLETQRRRPSTIAEQAMRKSGINCHQRYDLPMQQSCFL